MRMCAAPVGTVFEAHALRESQRVHIHLPARGAVGERCAPEDVGVSIAGSLHISEKTVEGCTGRIFSKLGLEADADQHRRVLAVLAYLQAT